MMTVIVPITSVSAAPAKHAPIPINVIHAMSSSTSEASALPLQLQIEAQVAGKQQLAYLPTTGPSMDFYYLNYRPIYIAGESKIDFWMLTPKGKQAPKTGSLELFDEFGKIRLAILAPEGTEIPQAIANKNKPFLWKSWKVPSTLKSGFEFSDKFRVILKTSDSSLASATNASKNERRSDSLLEFLVRSRDKLVLDNGNVDMRSGSSSAVSVFDFVQDRQFKIKGLQAVPGGKRNPANLNVNTVAPTAIVKENNLSSASRISSFSHRKAPTISENKGEEGQKDRASSSSLNRRVQSQLTLSILIVVVALIFYMT
ncbi:hypothetical protein BGZ99_003728 [Dissophora globulifera]|uniref:Uncharacterized protein n=1 Tax=Dissophora globulifera TaxID=979702 RepID=A0A9P6UUP8_9FUNG|nr:hypothetical protein BGZ99_003728 [Dissophora globulifera]